MLRDVSLFRCFSLLSLHPQSPVHAKTIRSKVSEDAPLVYYISPP